MILLKRVLIERFALLMKTNVMDDVICKYKSKIWLCCVVTSLSMVLPLIMTWNFKYIVEYLEFGLQLSNLIYLLISYSLFFIITNLSDLFLNYIYIKLINEILKEAREKYYLQIFEKEILEINEVSKADLINNFNMIKEYIEGSISPIVSIVKLAVSVIISVICIFSIEKVYLLPLFLFVVIWTVINILTNKSLKHYSFIIQNAKAEMFESTIAIHQGVDTILTCDKFKFFYKRYIKKYLNYIKSIYRSQLVYSIKYDLLNQLINYGSILFLILYLMIVDNSSLNSSSLLTIYYFMPYIFMPLPNITDIKSKYILKQTIKDKLNIINGINGIDKKNKKFNNEIDALVEFRNVCYQYSNSNKKIFDEFNLKIQRGMCYVIVGESGKGKTTLLNMILGLISPDVGEVINGNNKCTDISENSMIDNICCFTQNSSVFNDTILNNIIFDKNYLRERAFELCNRFNLLNELERDIVNENCKDSNISAGQRQRIVLLRLLCQDKSIYLFDEPTSFLDRQNENVFLEIIQDLKYRGKTLIIVTHHRAFEKYADKMIELK